MSNQTQGPEENRSPTFEGEVLRPDGPPQQVARQPTPVEARSLVGHDEGHVVPPRPDRDWTGATWRATVTSQGRSFPVDVQVIGNRLARVAKACHTVRLGKGDVVLLQANPVPGGPPAVITKVVYRTNPLVTTVGFRSQEDFFTLG